MQITANRKFRNVRLPLMRLRLQYLITRIHGRRNVLHIVSECPLVSQVTRCLKKQCYFLKSESKTVVFMLFKFDVYPSIEQLPRSTDVYVTNLCFISMNKAILKGNFYLPKTISGVSERYRVNVQSFLCLLIYK